MSMLQITSASYSRKLHWFIHVVDNLHVNLYATNESLFQQTKMHFIFNDRRVFHLRDYFYIKKNQTLNQLIIFVILY